MKTRQQDQGRRLTALVVPIRAFETSEPSPPHCSAPLGEAVRPLIFKAWLSR